MSLLHKERASDSPFVEKVMHGVAMSDGAATRPAENHWHMVFIKHDGKMKSLAVGPLTKSGNAFWKEGAEILWIQFKLGTFMPHLPLKKLLDKEMDLPITTGGSFWLKGSPYQIPKYEYVESFVERLLRDDILLQNPFVNSLLQNHARGKPSRTVRYHFSTATGLTQSHIRQFERANRAVTLLQKGVSISDTAYSIGYFDQSHLTKSLKQFIGYTPAQIIDSIRSE
jgi:AraC-like DNA-binding protein